MNKPVLDAIDIRILSAVQMHGQLSKSALAEMVNLSPSACWARLTRLKKSGLVNGYHADIALDKIADLIKVILIVSLKTHRKIDFERFERRINEVNGIVDCIATGGGSDYVMTVIGPSLAAFQALMEQLLDEDIGIDRYFTYITTRNIELPPLDLTKVLAGKSE